MLKTMRFTSLLSTAVILGAGLAHLFALPNKIHLPREDYLTVQQICQGWALLGIVLVLALVSTLIVTAMVRQRPRAFALTLIALLCITGSLVVFFAFTYPANQQTLNWTVLPTDWEGLRDRWEYSHAAGAILYLAALSALTGSLLTTDEPASTRRSTLVAPRVHLRQYPDDIRPAGAQTGGTGSRLQYLHTHGRTGDSLAEIRCPRCVMAASDPAGNHPDPDRRRIHAGQTEAEPIEIPTRIRLACRSKSEKNGVTPRLLPSPRMTQDDARPLKTA